MRRERRGPRAAKGSARGGAQRERLALLEILALGEESRKRGASRSVKAVAPIAGAVVTILSDDKDVLARAATDANGTYAVAFRGRTTFR